MKKILLLVVCLMFVSPLFGLDEFEISSKTRVHYILELSNNFSYRAGNQFYIDKSYLTLKADLNGKLSARVTLDFENSSDSGYDFYFKYAYLKYEFSDRIFLLSDELALTFGIQKNRFGYNQFKKNALPLRYFTVTKDLIHSADMGLMLSGEMISELFEYHLQILSGGGYQNWMSNFDDQYSAVFNLSFDYGKLLGADGRIGFSYQRAEADELSYTNAYCIYADFENSIFGISVDYVRSDLWNVEKVLSINLTESFSRKIDLAQRYDIVFGISQEAYFSARIKVADDVYIKPMFGSVFGEDYLVLVETEFEFGAKWKDKE